MPCDFFVKNWTFGSNNVLCLEIRFSPFLKVLCFFFDCYRLSLCQGSTWGISRGLLRSLLSLCLFLVKCGHFIISSLYAVASECPCLYFVCVCVCMCVCIFMYVCMSTGLNVLVPSVWFLRVGKEKNEVEWGERAPSLWMSRLLQLERVFATIGEQSGFLSLRLHLCDRKGQSMIRAQISSVWRTVSFWPILAPARCVLVAAETQVGGWVWGMGWGERGWK